MEYIKKSQVAKRYGFDLKSVTNWMNERGADPCWSIDKRKFREPEITEWVIKNIITSLREVDNKELMDQAKSRKLDAEARIVEMTAREKANSLIHIKLVEASFSKFSAMVRTSMLQVVTTQAQQLLEAATNTRKFKSVLAEIINERLNEVGQVMKSGEFLNDEEITQYSEDEDHKDGHSTGDSILKILFHTITILFTGYLILDLIQWILTRISSKIKQAPSRGPRLPASIVVHENRYQPINEAALAQYDDDMANYYLTRGSNTRRDTWSDHIRRTLIKENRPFILDYLHKQGWATR